MLNIIKIILFCSLLALPGTFYALGLNPPFDEIHEGREPEPFPKLVWQKGKPSTQSIRLFPAALDRHLTDQMPFRQAFVATQRTLRFQGLSLTLEELSRAKAKSPSNVLLGKAGWTFYIGDKSLLRVQGRLPFSADELEHWRKVLQERTDYLRRQGIRYVLFFGPDKPTIYPEFLPDYVVQSRQPSRLDQLQDYLREHSTVEILDARPAVRAMKTQYQVYYPNDTHWNDLGALAACHRLLETLGKPTTTCDLTRYTLDPNGVAFIGDLCGLGCPQPGTAIQLVPHEARRSVAPDWQSWWQAKSAVVENPAGQGRALVFHDSFFKWMEPFFSEAFGHTRYVRDFNLLPEVVEIERPDVVVHEIVERTLNVAVPKPLPPLVLAAEAGRTVK